MTGRLTFLQTDRVPLDEINGPWTWMIVSEYAIEQDAPSEHLIAAMIEDPSFVTDVHYKDHSRGPYLIAALNPSDYEPADISTVAELFADWITSEGPTVPLDPEPILRREIRPRLEGQDFYVLRDLNSLDRSALSENAETVAGWVEAVVVDRVRRRLRTIVCGSD